MQEGDVLFNNTNSVELVGKTALIREDIHAAFSNHITLIRARDGVCEGAWLALELKALWQQGFFAQKCNKWIGQAGYNTKMLEGTLISLPSLDEQRRIVTKVEGLTGRVREAKRLRAEARRDIQTIVDAGRDETLSGLKTIQFGKLVESYKNGIYKAIQFYGRGYPSVRMFNIQNGQVNLDGTPLLEVTREELEKYGLEEDGILINRVNSRELVGKAGIVPPGLGPCTFESKNIRVRVKSDSAVPAFIVEGLNSKIVRRQIWAKLKPAIGQATVNQDDLDQLEIPFISNLNDQRRIVAYLGRIRQKVETLNRAHEETETELWRLEQAILDKAFRGEL